MVTAAFPPNTSPSSKSLSRASSQEQHTDSWAWGPGELLILSKSICLCLPFPRRDTQTHRKSLIFGIRDSNREESWKCEPHWPRSPGESEGSWRNGNIHTQMTGPEHYRLQAGTHVCQLCWSHNPSPQGPRSTALPGSPQGGDRNSWQTKTVRSDH